MQAITIFGITGPLQAGKTTTALELAKALKERGYSCGGVLSPASGERCYVDVATGYSHPYYRPGDAIVDYQCRKISKDAIASGCRALKQGVAANVDVLFIDEIGKLEAKKKGFYRVLHELLPGRKKPVVAIIRNELVQQFTVMFGKPVTRVWALKPDGNNRIDMIVTEMAAVIAVHLAKPWNSLE